MGRVLLGSVLASAPVLVRTRCFACHRLSPMSLGARYRRASREPAPSPRGNTSLIPTGGKRPLLPRCFCVGAKDHVVRLEKLGPPRCTQAVWGEETPEPWRKVRKSVGFPSRRRVAWLFRRHDHSCPSRHAAGCTKRKARGSTKKQTPLGGPFPEGCSRCVQPQSLPRWDQRERIIELGIILEKAQWPSGQGLREGH